MHNILTIIKRDIKALLTHFFPLVIAIGLCMLPPLYAWFNIYSNWDPYGNSSNVKIAVASEDVGWTDDETGESYNAGDDVIDSLKENNSIDWVMLDSSEKCLTEGGESSEHFVQSFFIFLIYIFIIRTFFFHIFILLSIHTFIPVSNISIFNCIE